MKTDDWLLVAFLVILGVAAYSCAQAGEVSYYSGGNVACPFPNHRLGPMTAASKTLPCGSVVRLTTQSGSAIVTITDRGPFIPGRVIDVSKDVAPYLGLILPGHLPVTIERIR